MSSKPLDFHESFSGHMIRDFFLVLLAVIALEIAIGFAMVVYDFHAEQPANVEGTATSLAEDVRAIMLNEGGPVAARTVYPILDKDHEAIGMDIAIEPSEITRIAIEGRFDFTPEGIPARWPEGRYKEASIEVRAADACIECHVTASVDDVLGTVTVRRYFAEQVALWMEKVPLALTLGMGKILIHTVVLYFLLRARMASLLSLKSVVALLSKAGSSIEHRAAVNSHDEFGELAHDLNLFLDRVTQITDDLGGVLSRIVALNEQLSGAQASMLARYESAQRTASTLLRDSALAQGELPRLEQDWADAVRESATQLRRLARGAADESQPGLEALGKHLGQCVDDVSRARQGIGEMATDLSGLSTELREFAAPLREMAVIETTMAGISEQGQALLERLHGSNR